MSFSHHFPSSYVDHDDNSDDDIFLDSTEVVDGLEHAHNRGNKSRQSLRTAGNQKIDKHFDDVAQTLRTLPGQFPDRPLSRRVEQRPSSNTHIHDDHVDRPHVSDQSLSPSLASGPAGFESSSQTERDTYNSTQRSPIRSRDARSGRETNGQARETPHEDTYAKDQLGNGNFTKGVHLDNVDFDSAASQDAATNIWDEIKDIKSLMRRLEDGESRSVDEHNLYQRSQSGTTAPTTVSSSPQHTRYKSRDLSSLYSNELQPTLQSALSRAQSILEPHVFLPLEATVRDALEMAYSTTSPSTGASLVSSSFAMERYSRRKVDALCRNLVDLCITMCDVRNAANHVESSPASLNRPESRFIYARELRNAGGNADEEDILVRARTRTSLGSSIERSRLALQRRDDRYGQSPGQSSIYPRAALDEHVSRTDAMNLDRAPSRAITELGLLSESGRIYTSKLSSRERDASGQTSGSRNDIQDKRHSANFTSGLDPDKVGQCTPYELRTRVDRLYSPADQRPISDWRNRISSYGRFQSSNNHETPPANEYQSR